MDKGNISYNNLPVPSDTNALPSYLNNELITIGNTIDLINQETSGLTNIHSDIVATYNDKMDEIDNSFKVTNTTISQTIASVEEVNALLNTSLTKIDITLNDLTTLSKQAVKSADKANQDISVISDDGYIAQYEKSNLFLDWLTIYKEYPDIITKSSLYKVNSDAYTSAYLILANYLTSYPIEIDPIPTTGIAWIANQYNIPVDRVYFRNVFSEYYNKRQELFNSITEENKTDAKLLENKQIILSKEVSNILDSIIIVVSDNFISQSEKNTIFIDWKSIYDEKNGIVAQAFASNVSSVDYEASYATLSNYLISAPILIDNPPITGDTWCSDPSNISIDGTVFRNNFTDYYYRRQALLNAIANAAQTSANTALDNINYISSDGYLTQDEKPAIFVDWKSIYDERADIVSKASGAGVSSTAYTNSYNTLANYLTSSPILIENPPTTGSSWCSNSSKITIVGTTFRSNFTNYYNERLLLLNEITNAAQNLANNAQASANSALTNISYIVSDGYLTQDEKPSIFIDWKSIYSEAQDNVNKAIGAGVSSTAYTNSYNTLANYLIASPILIENPPTSGNAWCSNSSIISINGTTFRNNFTNYYNERQLLLNAITNAAQNTAVNAQTTANAANNAAADRLSKSVNNILSGTGAIISGNLVINSSGQRTSGNGVAMTSNGLVGFTSAGASTFAIDTNGNATFSGTLNAATGNFSSRLSNNMRITINENNSHEIQCYSSAVPSSPFLTIGEQYLGSDTMGIYCNLPNSGVKYGNWVQLRRFAATEGMLINGWGCTLHLGVQDASDNFTALSGSYSTGSFYIGSSNNSSAAFTQNAKNVTLNNASYAIQTTGDVYVSGAITATGNVTAYSDKRLKTKIKAITDPIKKLMSLSGNTFNWKRKFAEKNNMSKEGIGTIAQEVQAIFPSLVQQDKNGNLTVAESKLVPLLIEVCKNQELRIRALEKKYDSTK